MPPTRARARLTAVLALALGGVLLQTPGDARAAQACANADVAPTEHTLEQAATATLCLINRQRAERGHRPLRENRRLAWAATRHSRDMVARRFFSHTAPGGATATDRVLASRYVTRAEAWTIGESLAWATGHLATPAQIVLGWLRSPHHRALLLHPHFRRAGIGISPDVPDPRHAHQPGATYTLHLGTVDRTGPGSHRGAA